MLHIAWAPPWVILYRVWTPRGYATHSMDTPWVMLYRVWTPRGDVTHSMGTPG